MWRHELEVEQEGHLSLHGDQEGNKSMFKVKYILYGTIEGFFMVYLIRAGRVGEKTGCVQFVGRLKRNVLTCYATKTLTGTDYISQNCVLQYF